MKNTTIKFLTLGLLTLAISAYGVGNGLGHPPSFNIGTGFNNQITAISPVGSGPGVLYGDIYVGGDFTQYNGTVANRIVRLNSNGTVDSGFATGAGFNGLVSAFAPVIAGVANGDIYIGGNFTSYNGTGKNRIIRLNPNGTIDSGFNVGTGFNGTVFTLALATDGSGDIYVGGTFTSYNGVVGKRFIIRLNGNGTIDTGFNLGTGFSGNVRAIVLATDGSGDIYVGGEFFGYSGTVSQQIIRLNSNGTVDSGFAVGTGFNFNSGRLSVFTLALATDGSGDIYVGGSFTNYNGTVANRIIRLNSNGTVDSGFAIGAGFDFVDAYVKTLVPAPGGSGDIYVGGGFPSYNGTVSKRIIRLNSNGTVDSAFNIGTGFNLPVDALGLATDGSGDIYVGGRFTSYNGAVLNRIANLSATGVAH